MGTTSVEPCLPGGGCGGGSGPGETYGPMINKLWGQGCGFNDFTPAKSNGPCGHAPAGCGPVAVAQVLWYHKNRLGSMSYNGVPINFNNMPSIVHPSYGSAPDIARLMSFIGNYIIIDYAADYAMALPSKIPELFSMLGFDSELSDLHHGTVQGNIRAGKPVILKARTSGVMGISLNHHIWVCEGYRNYNYDQYYMNWGWNGGSNGWYYINNWNPSSNNYSEGRKMILIR